MRLPLLAAALACAFPAAAGPSQEDLRAALQARFGGDRTQVNLAAAVIAEDGTALAFLAADPKADRGLKPGTPFELGLLARTLAAALAEDAILRGTLKPDDALAKLLPGATVPDFEGRPVTLAHLLTQRSGLPALPGGAREPGPGPARAAALAALAGTKLEAAPGSRFQPSPFGAMLLSLALARNAGMDYPALCRERLFGPVGMEDARVAAAAPGEAQGHGPSGRPVPAWTFDADLSGAGGVKASIADLARFAETALGIRPGPAAAYVKHTLDPLGDEVPQAAPGWTVLKAGGRHYLVSEGNGSGTSALLLLDPVRHQGAALLADTSLATVGGLLPLGLSLLDPAMPSPGFARRRAEPGPHLRDGVTGRFRVQDGALLTLENRDGNLFARAGEGPSQALAFDTAGDFYGLDSDLLLHPVRAGDGYDLQVRTLGGVQRAERIPDGPLVLDMDALRAYEGEFAMASGFTAKVVAKLARIVILGMDVGEVPLRPTGKDTFASETSAIQFAFERDKGGKVIRLVLKTAGQTVKGERQ